MSPVVGLALAGMTSPVTALVRTRSLLILSLPVAR
jgi:hypothetical protein